MTNQGSRETTRRTFLLGAAGAAVAPALAACSSSGGTAAPTPAPTETTSAATDALAELERLLPGQVVTPGGRGYRSFVTPWNLRWQGERPEAEAVVRARSTADVQTAVTWAREFGVPIVARSGGHSYTGYSSTTGVLVDVSSMTSVGYDDATGVASLGGGVRNANVYAQLAKVDRTVTHGRCYQVGFAGLSLGGGIGFNMRRLGLTCDQLISTEMVLADGSAVRVSTEENPDLFWAIRGAGGGNFGIHTAFEVQTHPAVGLTVFDLVWTEQVDRLLPVLLDLMRASPREVGAKITVRAAPGERGPVLSVGVLGQIVGTKADVRRLFRPALAIAQPDLSLGFLRETAYWPGQRLLSEEGGREYSYERSRYVEDDLTEEAHAVVLESLRSWTGTEGVAQWKGFLVGGAINDVTPPETAFVHRTDWLLSTTYVEWEAETGPEEVEEDLAWADDLHAAMTPLTTARSYQNFIDESETDWQRAYHGDNLERLVQVKAQVDPANVFTFPQGIPTSL